MSENFAIKTEPRTESSVEALGRFINFKIPPIASDDETRMSNNGKAINVISREVLERTLPL